MDDGSLEYKLNLIWTGKLVREFNKINKEICKYLKTSLRIPNFEINNSSLKRRGQWNSRDRVISISLNLLRKYSWPAVSYVLRHEMAHMIVDEIFKITDANPHGEAFSRACKVIQVDDRRCSSDDFLSSFDYDKNDKVVGKIKKLMNLSSSSNENESNLALTKAYDIMLKFNMSYEDLDEVEDFMSRPVGRDWKKMPSYIHIICDIVEKFYFVNCIIIPYFNLNSGDQARATKAKSYKTMEIFGKSENLDVAEYVFHFLLNQGDVLWEKTKRDCKRDGIRVTKVSFLNGLYRGYFKKMEEEKGEIMAEMDIPSVAIVEAKDKILNDRFRNTYTCTSKVYTKVHYGAGFSEGHEAGKKLSMNNPIAADSGSGGVKQLN
mgnify:CR=1 FL=1